MRKEPSPANLGLPAVLLILVTVVGVKLCSTLTAPSSEDALRRLDSLRGSGQQHEVADFGGAAGLSIGPMHNDHFNPTPEDGKRQTNEIDFVKTAILFNRTIEESVAYLQLIGKQRAEIWDVCEKFHEPDPASCLANATVDQPQFEDELNRIMAQSSMVYSIMSERFASKPELLHVARLLSRKGIECSRNADFAPLLDTRQSHSDRLNMCRAEITRLMSQLEETAMHIQ